MYKDNNTADLVIDQKLPQLLQIGTISILYKRENLLLANFIYLKNGKLIKFESQYGYRHLILLILKKFFPQNKHLNEEFKDFKYPLSVNIPHTERFIEKKLIKVSLKKNRLNVEACGYGEVNGVIGDYHLDISGNTLNAIFQQLIIEFKI